MTVPWCDRSWPCHVTSNHVCVTETLFLLYLIVCISNQKNFCPDLSCGILEQRSSRFTKVTTWRIWHKSQSSTKWCVPSVKRPLKMALICAWHAKKICSYAFFGNKYTYFGANFVFKVNTYVLYCIFSYKPSASQTLVCMVP